MDFEVIFKPFTIALGYSNLERGINVRRLALSISQTINLGFPGGLKY